MTDTSPRLVASRARTLVDRVRDKAPGYRPLEAHALLLAGYQPIREFEGQGAADAAAQGLMAAAALCSRSVDDWPNQFTEEENERRSK